MWASIFLFVLFTYVMMLCIVFRTDTTSFSRKFRHVQQDSNNLRAAYHLFNAKPVTAGRFLTASLDQFQPLSPLPLPDLNSKARKHKLRHSQHSLMTPAM